MSVVVPAYQVADSLPRAVGSALEQLEGDVEVIIVDDASPGPETVQVAQRLAESDARVQLIRRDTNAGPGTARADALSAATGDWVAVLDADDRMRTGRLERLLEVADHTGADLVADNLRLVDSVAGPVGSAFPMAPGEVVDLTPERILVNCVPGGRVNLGWIKPIVRRSFLTDNDIAWRPFRHAEDVLFCVEVLAAGAVGVLVGEPGYDYTQRRGTVSGAPSPHSRTTRSAEEQIRVFDCLERVVPELSVGSRQRLDEIRDEIRVTTAVLAARDAFEQGRVISATRLLASSLRRPRALRRSAMARFGATSRRIV